MPSRERLEATAERAGLYPADLCGRCGEKSRVLDTRISGNTVCRRRECPKCGDRWTTYEARATDGARRLLRRRRTHNCGALFVAMMEATDAES